MAKFMYGHLAKKQFNTSSKFTRNTTDEEYNFFIGLPSEIKRFYVLYLLAQKVC